MNIRQQIILERLQNGREATVAELSRQLDVSLVTVRRDLDLLAQEHPVTRTHGGAVLSRAGVVEFRYQNRSHEHLTQKHEIAKYMRDVIRPGMTVVLDTGTTTREVARAISGTARLRILTSSLAIASALHTCENLDLVLLGGNVNHHGPDLCGPLTEDNLRRFRPQLAVVGADAIDPEGAYASDIAVASVCRGMLAVADETWMVADSSKFSRRSFVQFAEWEQIDHLVTDTGLSPQDRLWAEQTVASVHLVEVPPS